MIVSEMLKKFDHLIPKLIDDCVEYLKTCKSDDDEEIDKYMTTFINNKLRDQGIEVSIYELHFLRFYLAFNTVKKIIERGTNG